MTRLVLVLALWWPTVGLADFEAANAAYDEGNYATALKQLMPLVEQGDADAQLLFGRMYDKGSEAVVVLQQPPKLRDQANALRPHLGSSAVLSNCD